ncbi:MAG: TlpA disulfide reductase family protein [Methylovulum sp.]|nr:TlpA disulfide reductase family protein [Methylovulum sp.]
MREIKCRTVLLGLLVAVSLSGCHKRAGLQIGDAIPAVTLSDFHGRPVILSDNIKGKVTLLRFWSLDCGFCDKEVLLSLEPLYQKYKDKAFMPVAINVSRVVKTDQRLRQFDSLTYPMLVDEYGVVAKSFGVIGLPATFVIDEEGFVRKKMTGEAGIQEIEKLFTTILYKEEFYEDGH